MRLVNLQPVHESILIDRPTVGDESADVTHEFVCRASKVKDARLLSGLLGHQDIPRGLSLIAASHCPTPKPWQQARCGQRMWDRRCAASLNEETDMFSGSRRGKFVWPAWAKGAKRVDRFGMAVF